MAERSIARSSAISVARASVTREAKKVGWGLWVEAAIKAFWPVWAVLALAIGVVLLGIPALLPRELHYALLAAFAAAILFFAVRGVMAMRAPSEAEKLARLRSVSQLGVRFHSACTHSICPACLRRISSCFCSTYLAKNSFYLRYSCDQFISLL